ncbi:MAG: TonB-dependent receptor [Opitutaceae bacterium]
MHPRILLVGLGLAASLHAQMTPVSLPEVMVYSPRVANQEPTGTFATPVSALRFEPQVDVQARNLTEAQADVTIRGGIFENTGFKIGAVSITDPQTGHYYADLPIAPAMLGAPQVLTGAAHAMATSASTVGAIAYGWRPIQTVGFATLSAGTDELNREEFYQGYVSDQQWLGQKVAADVAWAHSHANGTIPYGDNHFDRVDGRVQLVSPKSQTDLFAGYQAKFFGWPNLYTPFNSDESENLQAVLVSLNHRRDLGGGDFIEAGAYHRRNKDDYAYNRFAPVTAVHPFQHTTWLDGAAVDGRQSLSDFILNYRGEVMADKLQSTSLTFGHFHTRTQTKFSLVPEKSWAWADGAHLVVKAGASVDSSNHEGSALSPVVEIAREQASAPLSRIYFSYATTTQVPSYTALNSSATGGLFRGNPNLGREKSHNMELGASGLFEGWTAQGAVFYRQDNNLVDWTFKRGVTARSANALDVATTGVEFVARRSWATCDLVLGYTVLAKDPDYRGALVDASFYALNYARQRLTAAIVVRLGREFEVRMDNSARIQAANSLRTVGGDDAIISALSLTYRPRKWRRATVTVQADNLWNSSFQEVPAVPASRRQLSAALAYAW